MSSCSDFNLCILYFFEFPNVCTIFVVWITNQELQTHKSELTHKSRVIDVLSKGTNLVGFPLSICFHSHSSSFSICWKRSFTDNILNGSNYVNDELKSNNKPVSCLSRSAVHCSFPRICHIYIFLIQYKSGLTYTSFENILLFRQNL